MINYKIVGVLIIALAGISSCNPTTPITEPLPEVTPLEKKEEPDRDITNLDTFSERSHLYKDLKPEKDITTKIDGTDVRIIAHPRMHFTITIGHGPTAGHGHGFRPEIEVFLSKPAENKQVAAYIARRAIQKAFNLTDSEITLDKLYSATPNYVTYIVDYKK